MAEQVEGVMIHKGILSFIISGYIIYVIKLTKEFWEILGLSLILGGALGNGLAGIGYSPHRG